MEMTDFQWDEDNVAHVARHKVYPDEVEELAFDDEPWIRKGRGRNHDELVKSPLAPFRSWFDTSPRTENQILTIYIIRSP
jgi:hypothetical protein